MARKNQRLSRPLIGVLIGVFVVGVVITLHKLTRSNAEAAPVTAVLVTPPAPVIVPAKASGSNATAQGTGASGSTATATTPPKETPAPLITQVPLITTSAPLTATPTTKPASATVASSTTQPAKLQTAPAVSAITNSGSDAASLVAAGKLVEARQLLNDQLFKSTDPQKTKQLKSSIQEISQTLVFGPKKFANDPFETTYAVKPGDKLTKIAADHDLTWEFLASINNIASPNKMRAGANLKVINGPFHAVVDKSDFTLDMYLGSPGEVGSVYVTTFRVGLGKEDSTPTGVWMVKIGSKLKNPKFWGAGGLPPMEADDPKNPLGEFWIGLEGTDGAAINQDGYGVHGTIDPASVGTQASLGCIRLADEDIKRVYELLVEGKSTVTVKP